MPNDPFFEAKNCDRCNKDILHHPRIMSWFNEETICQECSDAEREIRQQLPDFGKAFEGCGYIPVPEKEC